MYAKCILADFSVGTLFFFAYLKAAAQVLIFALLLLHHFTLSFRVRLRFLTYIHTLYMLFARFMPFLTHFNRTNTTPRMRVIAFSVPSSFQANFLYAAASTASIAVMPLLRVHPSSSKSALVRVIQGSAFMPQ